MIDLPPDPPAIVGRASVIDADTLDIRGERIRIWGVDAPESGQECEAGGRSYRCGQAASLALSDWLGQRPVACVQIERDRYQRIVATCSMSGQDVGGWLVRSGWAVEYTAYSDGRYRPDEDAAAAAGVGIHRGEFSTPWGWRQAQRPPQRPAQVPPSECAIKGNINRDGERIYHLPASSSYADTRIDTSDGERWFCSEDEARAAGWRPRR